MVDTLVYSNTGGQNLDSTPMLGGNDMNVFGAATQGKNVEKKTVAEIFLAGHGSPFIAQPGEISGLSSNATTFS
jgi:pyruvate-ferredoxin/flavodoxin oxidoreductase